MRRSKGWVYATLMFKDSPGAHRAFAGRDAEDPDLRNALLAISREFDKIKLDELTERFADIVAASPEAGLRAADGSQVGGGAAPGEASEAMAPAQMGKQEALQRFSVDLTERARKGRTRSHRGP
jgi:type VI secretion system protein VasG